jgi:transposase
MEITNFKQLLEIGLELDSPWEIEKIEFKGERGRLEVEINYQNGSLFNCPKCGKKCKVKDSKIFRWRHLNFFQWECYITARVPRTRCDEDKVLQVTVPWSRSRSGFTLLFESLALVLMRDMLVNRVAKLLHEHDTRLWRLINYYVNAQRSKEDYSNVSRVGIDETASKRGHNYISVFVDLDTKKLIYATAGRKAEVVSKFVKDFEAHQGQRENVKVVTCDFSKGFTSDVQSYLPEAQITYDKFHAMQLVNKALEKMRRAEVNENEVLKSTRFIWLKNPSNLTKKQEQKVISLRQMNLDTAEAYNLKLSFGDLFKLSSKEEAEPVLLEWCNWALGCQLAPFKTLRATILEHKDRILNWFDSRSTNGVVEGINSLIQLTRTRARGFRNINNFINMAYVIAGKLKLDYIQWNCAFHC